MSLLKLLAFPLRGRCLEEADEVSAFELFLAQTEHKKFKRYSLRLRYSPSVSDMFASQTRYVRERAFAAYQTNQFFIRHKFRKRRIRARKILRHCLNKHSAIPDVAIPAGHVDDKA